MKLNKEGFDKAISSLRDSNYRVVANATGPFRGDGKDYLYKVITRADDEQGESRAVVQLLFRIWHLEEFAYRLPAGTPLYSLEPVIEFSRSTNERVSLSLSWPERSIEECERIAKEFGEWAFEHIP